MAQEMPGSNPTALVVLVPEADRLVGPYRLHYDPSAADGMPAHITVLYPFMPESAIDGELHRALEQIVRRVPTFGCTLRAIQRWPDVLWLDPHPDVPFRVLTEACVSAFPAYPPYSGEVDEPIPHLTAAQVRDSAELDAIEASFHRAAAGRLPLAFTVARVSLMALLDGRWTLFQEFLLGS